MDNNPAYRADSFICDGCPAAYALGGYAEKANQKDSFKGELEQQEAIKAGEVLNEAAEKVGCRDKNKRLPKQAGELSEIRRTDQILLATICPSFSEYMHLRQPDMPTRTAKVLFNLIGLAGRLRYIRRYL